MFVLEEERAFVSMIVVGTFRSLFPSRKLCQRLVERSKVKTDQGMLTNDKSSGDKNARNEEKLLQCNKDGERVDVID
jgi:hypothetical protein